MGYDNRIPDYAAFLEFNEVYLRAIALAWKDETFKKMLLKDAGKAIEAYFNYRCPWSIDLSARELTKEEKKKGGGWHPSTDTHAGFWRLPVNVFSFNIPPKPKDIDSTEEAIAMAAYNDSGPTYLFTCC